MSILIDGFILGLLLAFLVGPIFFVLIETSYKRGIKAAVFFDIGVLSADLIYIILGIYFSNYLLLFNKEIIFFTGSAFFLIMGILYFFKKIKRIQYIELGYNDIFKLFTKGFIYNILTPTVFFFWLGVITVAIGKYHQKLDVLVYMSSVLLSYAFMDILKIVASKQLRKILTLRKIMIMNRIIALLFIMFSFFFFYKGIYFGK